MTPSAQLKASGSESPGSGLASNPEHELKRLIELSLLDVVFQPILGLSTRNYLGYEALIRPRPETTFSNPTELFELARQFGLSNQLDHACRLRILEAYAAKKLPGSLFINAVPSSLLDPEFQQGETLRVMRRLNIAPSRIVIEITEHQPIEDFETFRDVLNQFRNLGYRIAIDDLGQGMSNLRMWTEIHPDFVKIDRHFIHGISQDALKFQLVRAMHGMAETCGACIVAEGVEHKDDFRTLRDIGIPFVQGYFIARPNVEPPLQVSAEISQALAASRIAVFPGVTPVQGSIVTARALLNVAMAVSPELPNDALFDLLEADPTTQAVAIVLPDGTPQGIVTRTRLIEGFARPYRREIFGRRACTQWMDPSPLVVDEGMPIQDLSRLITSVSRGLLQEWILITECGRYIGLGRVSDMVALITDMQIRAARYSNPLTQLPGNVPISEHIDRLLGGGAEFVACYADLDSFKPFNDVYGYRRGDDLIQLVAELLVQASDLRRDFVGHIGGDDFLILFQRKDWQAQCEQVLKHFAERAQAYFDLDDQARGGILSEDRSGRAVIHALPTLSIGALPVESGVFASHHEISAAAAEAKKQAKRIRGNSLFVERRKPRVSPQAIF